MYLKINLIIEKKVVIISGSNLVQLSFAYGLYAMCLTPTQLAVGTHKLLRVPYSYWQGIAVTLAKIIFNYDGFYCRVKKVT